MSGYSLELAGATVGASLRSKSCTKYRKRGEHTPKIGIKRLDVGGNSETFQSFCRVLPIAITLSCHPLIAPERFVQGLSSGGFLSSALSCREMILSFRNAFLLAISILSFRHAFHGRSISHGMGLAIRHRSFSAVAACPQLPGQSMMNHPFCLARVALTIPAHSLNVKLA
jgi:hypothetical protein